VGKPILVATILGLILFSSAHLEAEEKQVESGCTEYAWQWVNQIDQLSRSDVLIRNVQSDCQFAAKWIKMNSNSSSAASWNRTCTDLVLIWTHKKCIYYRDYIDPRTYEPCKEWTRVMYQHCIDQDEPWF
jgi:hypothetical protein